MAMSFATMQTLIDATPDVNAKIRIMVDYLRDNSIDTVVSNAADGAAAFAITDAIPAADAEDSATVWNDSGVLKVSSAGA